MTLPMNYWSQPTAMRKIQPAKRTETSRHVHSRSTVVTQTQLHLSPSTFHNKVANTGKSFHNEGVTVIYQGSLIQCFSFHVKAKVVYG